MRDLYDRFHELFFYDERSGDLVRKVRRCGRALKGDVIRSESSGGYYRVYVDGKRYLAHRVIYLMVHGYLPKMIDHKNRNKKDNRIDNLRPATRSLNMFNRDVFSNNTSGSRGVSLRDGRWRARIQHQGVSKFLGNYDTKEEAVRAYEYERAKLTGDEGVTEGKERGAL